MKLSRIALITILLMITLCGVTVKPAFSVEDAIIAVVNDEVITLKDLRDHIQSAYVSLSSKGLSDSKIKEILMNLETEGLQTLIEQKLILSEANSLELDVSEKALDEKIDEIKSKYASDEAFHQAISDYGLTINDVKNKILTDLKVKFMIDHEISSKINVKPQEITNYYNKNIDLFKKPEMVDLNSIFISKNTDEKAKTKAEEALNMIKDGADFDAVAKKYSITPPIGIIEKGQALKKIEDSVFSLSEGEVSNIVDTEMGYYIFKLKKIIPPKVSSLDEVKDEISDILYNQKHKKKYKKWIEELKNKYYVEIK